LIFASYSCHRCESTFLFHRCGKEHHSSGHIPGDQKKARHHSHIFHHYLSPGHIAGRCSTPVAPRAPWATPSFLKLGRPSLLLLHGEALDPGCLSGRLRKISDKKDFLFNTPIITPLWPCGEEVIHTGYPLEILRKVGGDWVFISEAWSSRLSDPAAGEVLDERKRMPPRGGVKRRFKTFTNIA
jgi:hypothetical protein